MCIRDSLWSVIPPSSGLALQGARAIFNPSAGTELTGKAAYRRELVKQQSGRCLCAYVLSSAGVHESTTDTVFGGHSLIADNGRLAAEGERFGRESALILADAVSYTHLTLPTHYSVVISGGARSLKKKPRRK